MSGNNDITPAGRPVYDERIDEKYDEKDMQIQPADTVHQLDSAEEAHVKQ